MLFKTLFTFGFFFFYWFCCFLGTGSDQKNLRGLRSYPQPVQDAVRNSSLAGQAPKEKSLPSILLGNLLLFTVVFTVLGLVLKGPLALTSFHAAFLYFLVLGEGLGLFDLVVIDLLWWRNTPRIRFSFLPEKEPYQDPAKHIGSFVRGIPLFLAAALSAAWLVTRF